jgi:cytochrome c biogenesis protein CcdA/thiol-disulfide isomerase/thioredoxin
VNGWEIFWAFLEGIGLILSPCILPVLPLVLSTSIDGGKARPFGIIAGFIVAFSSFVLLSRQLVEAFHVNTDSIRNGSLALLFVLGVVLLFDKLSESFSALTQGAADFGGKFGAGNEGGFVSGVVIGCLIGLVWTPCAGPILAAVLVQVLRQQTDLQSVFVTVGFALGAGIPMFIIAMTGRSMMKRFGFLTRHTVAVRKIFALLIILSAVYLAFGSNLQSLFQRPEPAVVKVSAPVETQFVAQLEKPLDNPYPAPPLAGIQAWVNSKPLILSELKGKVVLIDFWTYSCINCVRTLPYVTAWDRRYRDKGLVIIGVHSPEFEFEKNVDNIKAAAIHYGIDYPIAVDNDLATWVSFQNKYWPAHYLIDQNGQVVYTHFGEGDCDITENNIRYLLGVKGNADALDIPAASPSVKGQTQETYLGYARADHFAGTPALHPDAVATYRPADTLPENSWSLDGAWKVEKEKITAQRKDNTLRLNFTAPKVFLVMGTSSGQPQKVMLKLNGEPLRGNAGKDAPNSIVTVNGHALYELVHQASSQNGLLEISPSEPGFEAYAFTFGN